MPESGGGQFTDKVLESTNRIPLHLSSAADSYLKWALAPGGMAAWKTGRNKPGVPGAAKEEPNPCRCDNGRGRGRKEQPVTKAGTP